MLSFWGVVWIVLMIIWLFGGCYWVWEPTKPYMLGTQIIPWVCVAILGASLFGGISMGQAHALHGQAQPPPAATASR